MADNENLEELFIQGKIKSFDDIIKQEKYPDIKRQIDDFFLVKTIPLIGSIDTIICMERKGSWILKDFFLDNPKYSSKFNIISNYEIFKLVETSSVLIFDDSLKTGNTILRVINEIKKYRPKYIGILCLLINKEAVQNLNDKHPNISIFSCLPTFDTYAEQSKEFLVWETVNNLGLKIRDNPDFPIVEINTPYPNMNEIKNILKGKFSECFKIENCYDVESTASYSGVEFFTFDLKSLHNEVCGSDLNKICDFDFAKIRCFITSYSGLTKIKIHPIINPKIDFEKCDILSVSPEKCLCIKYNLKRNEDICGPCCINNINFNYAKKIQDVLRHEFIRKGILIESIGIKAPKSQSLFSI